jgi:hypothetical protein
VILKKIEEDDVRVNEIKVSKEIVMEEKYKQ